MKKSRIICFVIGMSLVCCACSSGKSNSKEIDTENAVHSASMNGWEEETIDLDSSEIDFSVDDKRCSEGRGMFETNDGFFFSIGPSELSYFDKKTKKVVRPCNKPDCNHTEEDDCCAVLGTISKNYDGNIHLYNNQIYFTSYDTKKGVEELYVQDLSGKSRECVAELFDRELVNSDSDTTEIASMYSIIHRGVFYYIDNSASKLSVTAVDLETKESKMIFEQDGARANLYRLFGYKNYIFFQAGNFEDDNYVDIKAGIFAYNIDTGKVSLVKADACSSYSIYDDVLYCSMEDGIYSKSLTDDKEKKIMEQDAYCWFFVIDGFIYVMSDDNILSKYDLAGDKITEIKMENSVFYIGEDYIYSDNGEKLILYDINSGEAEYIGI